MSRSRDFILPASLLLLVFHLSALPALAAGTITGLTASPTPANVGAKVTVTVLGNGSCKELHVDFGDGSPPAPLASVDFAKGTNTTAPAHWYAAAKTYSLTATPIKDCTGSASGNLVVSASTSKAPELMPGTGHTERATGLGSGGPGKGAGGSGMKPGETVIGGIIDLSKLCILTGACAPKISFALGAVSPGKSFMVAGSNFGTPPGKAFLTGDFGTLTLEILEWGSGYAHLKTPDVTGVLDHQAKVRVQSAAGSSSNEWPVKFIAKRKIFLLPSVMIKQVNCGNASEFNACNNIENGKQTSTPLQVSCLKTSTICGYHQNENNDLFPGGTDSYTISLPQGATLNEYDFTSIKYYPEDSVKLKTPFPYAAASSWNPSIQYSIAMTGWCGYTLNVYVLAPEAPWPSSGY